MSTHGVSLADQWCLNIEYWLGSFLIFQGIPTSIAKKPSIFVIFQGGGGGGPDSLSPLLDPHMVFMYFTSFSLFTWSVHILGSSVDVFLIFIV